MIPKSKREKKKIRNWWHIQCLYNVPDEHCYFEPQHFQNWDCTGYIDSPLQNVHISVFSLKIWMHKQIPSEKWFMTKIKRHYHETRPLPQHQSSSPLLGCPNKNVNPGNCKYIAFPKFPSIFLFSASFCKDQSFWKSEN